MPSLRERVFNVARALANFDSCTSWPFTAATSLSRLTIASAASVFFIATDTCFPAIVPPGFRGEKSRQRAEKTQRKAAISELGWSIGTEFPRGHRELFH